MRVLVVHPHAQDRRRFVRVLADSGHSVAEAADPTAALIRCRAEHPDVAILHGEACNGLVAEIKADPHAYGTAIVMVSPPGLDRATALQAIRRGIVDFLVEPVADGELLARVEAAGRTKDLQHELMAQGARLEALLREDALTGLLNRRAILTQLAGMVSGARRHGHPLSIAVCDIDHFKRVNDTHGHQAGDEVLVGVAHAMGTHLRQEDQLGRLGGEEFLVLLPDTDADAAMAVAERMREEVAHAAMPVPVTVSIGIATWEDAETPEAFLARADEALYAAKDAGRDRVLAATLHDRT